MLHKSILGAIALALAVTNGRGDDDIRDLLRAKLETAKQLQRFYMEAVKSGGMSIASAEILDSAKKVLDAELELAENREQRVTAWSAFVNEAKQMELVAETAFKAGRLTPAHHYEVKYRRLDAEIGLARAKAK